MFYFYQEKIIIEILKNAFSHFFLFLQRIEQNPCFLLVFFGVDTIGIYPDHWKLVIGYLIEIFAFFSLSVQSPIFSKK